MALISDKAAKNIIAVLWMAALFAASFLIPDRAVLPLCIAAAAIGFGGVYGVRAYVSRINRVAKALNAAEERVPMTIPAELLSGSELTFLGLQGAREPDVHLAALRRREDKIVWAGVLFGMLGLWAILFAVVTYGD